MVHALSGQWPYGKSKLDLKQSSLRRVRSSNLNLASWRAELVGVGGVCSEGRNAVMSGATNCMPLLGSSTELLGVHGHGQGCEFLRPSRRRLYTDDRRLRRANLNLCGAVLSMGQRVGNSAGGNAECSILNLKSGV